MMDGEKIAEIQKVMSTNDATIVGVLIVVTVALGWTVVYLFKVNQSLHKENKEELKANSEVLLKVNNAQNEFVSNIVKLEKR